MMVPQLLKAKAGFNMTSNTGWIALHMTALNGHGLIVWQLLKAEADVNVQNNCGWDSNKYERGSFTQSYLFSCNIFTNQLRHIGACSSLL